MQNASLDKGLQNTYLNAISNNCNGNQMAKVCKHNSHSNSLVVTYYNARSLLPKTDHLRVLVATDVPDVVCIVESWLESSNSNIEIALPGYTIVRLDRNRHGGGILMYIHASLHFSIITSRPLSLEFLLLSVAYNNCSGKTKLFIGLFYRPPCSSIVICDTLFSVLESLNHSMLSRFVLVGDFNVNYLDHDHSYFNILSNNLDSFNLTQVVSEPTHVCNSNGGGCLIDFVVVSNPDHLLNCLVIPELANSDHFGICFVMKWKPHQDYVTPRKIWRYNHANFFFS